MIGCREIRCWKHRPGAKAAKTVLQSVQRIKKYSWDNVHEKALSFVPVPLGIFFVDRLLFIGASSLNEHEKIVNTEKEIVAFKSNRSGEWYVLPRYRLLLSRHMLERIAQRQSRWKYWFGKKA